MERDNSPEGRGLPSGFRFVRLPQGLGRSTIEHLHISPSRSHHRSSSPNSHAPHSPVRFSRPYSRPIANPPYRPTATRRPSTENEAEVIQQVRDFDTRYGDANRTRVIRARRRGEQANFRDYESWNIAGLFGASDYYEEVEGAVGYDHRRGGRYPDESEDDADRHRALVDFHTRTYVGRSLINSRIETEKLLLLLVLELKVRSPNLTSDSAWQQVVEWLKRERVIERDNEADTLWTHAFRESPRDHFGRIWSSSVTTIRDLWSDLQEIF